MDLSLSCFIQLQVTKRLKVAYTDSEDKISSLL